MRLGELFPESRSEAEVSALVFDNRQVTPGALFFCVPGFSRDGHDFAAEAVAAGAVALVVERELPLDVPQVKVPSVRAAMAGAAARFAGDPTAELRVVGITGTNGKTTSAFLVRSLLEAGGASTGLLGTVKSIVGGVEHEMQRTTPEAIDLQRTFRQMLEARDRACVMEVSSHALSLQRVDAIHFAAAIFTNLTQDHLDFHPTMEDYFQAKRRLFADFSPPVAVINIDDAYGTRLAAEFPAATTVGIDSPQAAWRATNLQTGLSGSTFRLRTPAGEAGVRSPLTGHFNVLNVLGALAAAHGLGVPLSTCVKAVAAAGQVPGRFQAVDEGQDFAVLVDYAHTPDSLENVLQAARPLATGQLWVVFGCGGDRDRGKRPLMGEIAARLADRVIVTSDNPRSEDPEAIVAEVAAGAGSAAEVLVDRHEAITRAVAGAGPGDVVVIAGKGHEQGQEFAGGHKIPFDDVSVARSVLTATPRNWPPET